jgi:N-acetylneuraminic acid mutarotase
MGAVGFSIGTMGYIGTGDGGGGNNYKTDIWQYNSTNNGWNQEANNFPGTYARSEAVGFSIGAKGYIGTGEDNQGNYFNDLWEFDPSTDVWTYINTFSPILRIGAVGFSIGAKGYIGTGYGGAGYNGGYKTDIWQYDPSTNLWVQKADFPGDPRSEAVGFSIGTKGYIGTGYNGSYYKDFWEYDASTNQWTRKTDFPGDARSEAVGFSIGAKGYIGTGYNGSFYSDFYEYNPSTNAWTGKANFGGGGRSEAVGFSIGAKGYIGTGKGASGGLYNDFWEYTPTDNYRVSIASTDWNLTTTWNPTGIPAATDDVIVQNAVTINGSPLAVCNDLTINFGGSLTINSGGALTVNGSLLSTGTLDATASGNTVNYNGAAQNVNATTYNDLVFSGTGTKTLQSAISISNNLSINGGVMADLGTYTSTTKTLTLGDAVQPIGSYGGTGSGANYIITTFFAAEPGILNVTSSCTKGTWLGDISTDWNIPDNWCGSIIPTSSTNVTIHSGVTYQPTIGSAGGLCNSIDIQSGTSLTISGSYLLTVYGVWVNNGTFNAGTGTVSFSGTNNISGSSINSFNNITISGTLSVPSSQNINVAGNWINNSTFTAGTGTVTFNGTTQSIGGSASTTFNDLIINSGTTTLNTATIVNGNLTINAGTLIIASGVDLTVNGTLTNNAGTSGLVINDGGSLIYAYGAPMGTIQRLVTPGTRGSGSSTPSGYHFMSSPVTSTTFGNVLGNNENLIWAQSYSEPTNTWINQYLNNSLTPGTGYSIWVDPSLPTQTAIFSGTFNYDGVSQTLTNSGNSSYTGWNLIGNPYTSAIDWDYVPTWHGSVDATVYIWSGTQYSTWTPQSGFGAMANSDIPAQSGFFVHLSTGTSATVNIPWAARVHSSHSLYKDAVPNLLHLGITGNNYRDDTYIRFIAGATAGFDTQYDAYKLWGISDAPQLYSIISGANLAGNALPSIESNPEVSVGLKVGAETTYTITADGMESFDASVPIHLDDLKLGVSTDLRENPAYSFTAPPGDSANRFRVRFNSSAGIDQQKAVNIFIYTANEQIVLNNTGNYEGNYYVYNTTGQLMATLQMLPGNQYISSLPVGMYIVKAVTGSTIITRKVVLL